jgi:hypothetical protein
VYGRRYPGAEVRKAEFSDLKDLGIPVRIELEVFAPKLLSDEDGGVVLEEVESALLRLMLGERLSQSAAQAERTHDLLLQNPIGGSYEVVYELPEGVTLEELPKDAELKSEVGSYQRTYERRGAALRGTWELRLDKQRIDTEGYGEWRRFANEVDRLEDERVKLERKETRE